MLTVKPLYRQAMPAEIGDPLASSTPNRARLTSNPRPSRTFSSLVYGNDASTMVRFPGHIQAQLAASSSIRVSRLCLHCPRGFKQFLALDDVVLENNVRRPLLSQVVFEL